jgi:hypothetical protein
MLICKVKVEKQVNLSLYPSLPQGPLCGERDLIFAAEFYN